MPAVFNFFILVIKGILVGVANIVPGVSGGTIAVTLGIYQPLIHSLSHLPKLWKEKSSRQALILFLLPIFIGVGLGVILFAKLMGWLLQNYPTSSQLFFVGLIVGSIPLLFKLAEIKKKPVMALLGVVLGLAVMGVVVYAGYVQGRNSAPILPLTNDVLSCIWYQLKMIACGFLAAFAMVIPGISGSLLLVIVGEYHHILEMISRVTSTSGVLHFGYSFSALGLLALGVLLGVISCAKSMSWFLEKHKTFAIAFILGLMVISAISIWPQSMNSNPGLFINIIVLICGATGAYLLGKNTNLDAE